MQLLFGNVSVTGAESELNQKWIYSAVKHLSRSVTFAEKQKTFAKSSILDVLRSFETVSDKCCSYPTCSISWSM